MARSSLSIVAANQPGVLVKVATVISGRGLNIHEISGRVMDDPQKTRIVVDFLGDEDKVGQVRGQLEKLEVVEEVAVVLDSVSAGRKSGTRS
jgi:acetolactate synthase-1/3 small subunit